MSEITQIVWSDDFAVGHKELDAEHLRLVETVNAIYEAASAASERVRANLLLDELAKFAGNHFKHENVILMQISRKPIPANVERLAFIAAVADAVLDRHIAEHVRGLRTLNAIIHDMRIAIDSETGGPNPDLKEWFVEHMAVHDARLKPIFAALKHDQARGDRAE